MYEPTPIDTSKINIPDDLMNLLEILAENVHDTWAELRIAEGWTLGPVRDGLSKQHPCLIPYAELSESEKDYDKKTAIETLKIIISLGYKIEKISSK